RGRCAAPGGASSMSAGLFASGEAVAPLLRIVDRVPGPLERALGAAPFRGRLTQIAARVLEPATRAGKLRIEAFHLVGELRATHLGGVDTALVRAMGVLGFGESRLRLLERLGGLAAGARQLGIRILHATQARTRGSGRCSVVDGEGALEIDGVESRRLE